MGIGVEDLELLMLLKQKGYIPAERPAIVEIGAQQLANTFLDAHTLHEQLRQLFAVAQPCPLSARVSTHIVHGGLEHLSSEAPMARDFWLWLGFDYASIDIDGSPGSIPLDLNYDDVPPQAQGKYHLVTNFGTTEHVANQLNAFKAIHDLAAPGGVMVHHLPSQGMFNHGLVNYNPKFFWMLARSNGYEMLHMDYKSAEVPYTLPENIIDFISGFRPDIAKRGQQYRAADAALMVMMRKAYDIPYVAPLDVPTNTQTDNKVLRERYWTVFEPNAFQNLRDKRCRIPEPLFSRVKRKLKMKIKEYV